MTRTGRIPLTHATVKVKFYYPNPNSNPNPNPRCVYRQVDKCSSPPSAPTTADGTEARAERGEAETLAAADEAAVRMEQGEANGPA